MASSGRHKSVRRRRKALLKAFRRATGVGAVPGSIETSAPAGGCRLTRLIYSAGDVTEEQLPDHTRITAPPSSEAVTWIRVQGQPDAATLQTLARVFGIHSLALEDVVNSHQRCKVEDYGSHLYVVARLPRILDDDSLVTEQVNLFIGIHFLISIHDGPDFLESVRERIIRSRARIRELPADYLGYAILDTVTDHYFPVIEQIGNRLNLVDDMIEDGVTLKQRSEIRVLRGDLLLLRRSIWPQRDAVAALMRDDCEVISATTRTYLRDCYDHTVQIIDVTEMYRELCADLRDFHLSEITYRSSEVMKSLTIIATLFMPLSFVAGFYGMNFHYMPELSLRYGYQAAVLLMVGIAASLTYWFYRRGWLTAHHTRRDGDHPHDPESAG